MWIIMSSLGTHSSTSPEVYMELVNGVAASRLTSRRSELSTSWKHIFILEMSQPIRKVMN